MTASQHRRSGVTLLEVLVAMFTMAIGLLALLTLFPLGAIQMAQAIKDDRTGTEATHADALLRDHWRSGNDVGMQTAFLDPQAGLIGPQVVYPASGLAGGYPTPTLWVVGSTPVPFPSGSPSYPVYLDPLGLRARGGPNPERSWAAFRSITPATFAIPRRDTLFLGTPQQALEACSLTDDLTFEKNGMAKSGPVERQGQYNWAAIVQRPRNDVPSVADLKILVFRGRAPLLANNGEEVIVQPTVTIGERTVTLTIPNRDDGSAPLIRRGGWILDSSIKVIPIRLSPTDPVNDFVWIRHANFYRISGLTDLGPVVGGNQFQLDLETPIKPLWNGRTTYADATTTPISYTASITLLAGLSEVFERQQLRPDTPSN